MVTREMKEAAKHIDDPQAVLDEYARRDFIAFLIRAFAFLRGGATLDLNWHLDAIAHQLQRVADGENQRLLVTIPPRSLKSIMISVAWVAWRLGRDPGHNFVCASYSNELSHKHGYDCRRIMQSDWYRRMFPGTVIARGRSAVHDFETTRGGGRLATSVTGSTTGRGGGTIIIDDPIKPEDTESDLVRNSVNDWYKSTVVSRPDNKRTGSIITVMQRLHQYDLAGVQIETGNWEHLNLPAIATEDAIISIGKGRVFQRREGDVLHPSREPYDVLMEHKRETGSRNWNAQYQQRPDPAEGNMVLQAWLNTYGILPPGGQIVQSYDTATKANLTNDYSVCITALVWKQQVYILDVLRRRMIFPDLRRTAVAHAREQSAQVLLIEDQASGQELIQMLVDEKPSGVPRPIACRPDGDKKTRLSAVTSMIEAGQLLLPPDAPWLSDFRNELLSFPSGRFDDQVDALSQLLIWVSRQQRVRAVVNAGPELVHAGQHTGDTDWDAYLDAWFS
jgi:predicted phage terminase large subunit-like protein